MDQYEKLIGLREYKLKAKRTKNFGAFKSQQQRFYKFIIEKKKERTNGKSIFKIICFGCEYYYFFDTEVNCWRQYTRKIRKKLEKNNKSNQHLIWTLGRYGY